MIILGLTGSIGMGKSTTAKMFADLGVPVHDSDAAVHALYAGDAARLIEAAFPGVMKDDVVDRAELGTRVLGNRDALTKLEAIIHPLVRAQSDAFVARHHEAGAPLVVLDIPLLFETKAEDRVDKIAVVSAPADVQRERVLARPGMTEEKFLAILAKQIPDTEKRARADFVIDTGNGLDAARATVSDIVHRLQGIQASS